MANKTIYPFGTEGQLPSGIALINDLKTGGADKALTAEQGKFIGGLIYMMKPIELSNFGSNPGLIGSGGTWTATNAHKFTQIKVTPGEVYVLKAHATNSSYYAFLSELGVWVANGSVPYATGETGRRGVTANKEATFTIPEDCAYLYIALNNAGTTDQTPQGLWLQREVLQAVDDGDAENEESIKEVRGTWPNLFDYESATVLSNDASKITIEKSDGEIIIENTVSTNGKYAMVSLPALVPGKTYRMEIEYTAGFNKASAWYFAFIDSSYATTSGGVNLYPGGRRVAKFNFTHNQASAYIRLASTSQNNGAKVVIHSISIYENKTTLVALTNRVIALEEGSGSSEMENLIRQARFVAASPTTQSLALVHFTDIHGDSAAAVTIKNFAQKYARYIDDLVQTGDTVYYYWNSAGQGYEWYQQNGIPEALFVLGNHDGAADDNSQGWKEGSADWDFKGKEWDFDTYFADYITSRGVTPPSGYDDPNSPYYKACYWHKDYASAKIRVIGLDCMHFNDGVRYTSNDQETWLAAKLQETLTSGNAAYGFSVVFLCHYPLDDYSGNNEEWNDETHKFRYNHKSDGGHVMQRSTSVAVAMHNGSSFTAEAKFSMRNRVGTVGSPNYTKGNNNPIGDIIQSWMNSGGKYLAWLSGHTHTNYMYYPAKYPEMLVIGLPQAGNTRGTSDSDRANDSAMHTCANYIVFDTQNSLIKIVRIGKTTNRLFFDQTKLCYNYSEKSVYNR